MRGFLLTSISLLFIACGSTPSVIQSEKPATPGDVCCSNCINPNLGKIVEVKGTLQNTKLAPTIAANGFNVYCMESILPMDNIGKQVIARGRLERTDQFAARPIEGHPGVVTQGTVPGSSDLVLFECTYEVTEAE
jgi:hypothetical protein